MEEKKNPTLDFEALSALSEEERASAIEAYRSEVEALAVANAEARCADELEKASYATAKYRLASEGTLSGFGERIEAIEAILAGTPVLHSLPHEEKLRTAYYIDRGMREPKSPSAEELFEQLRNNPEAMRLCEAAILEKLHSENKPSFYATSGAASLPLTPQKKPKSIDEASSLARAAFGI